MYDAVNNSFFYAGTLLVTLDKPGTGILVMAKNKVLNFFSLHRNTLHSSRYVLKFLVLFLFPLIGRSQSQSQTLKYQWRKISGPSQYRIVSPHSASTNVTDLVEGVYKFELKVTNNLGLSSRDTMTLTVNGPDPDKNSVAKGTTGPKLTSSAVLRSQ
jgi:hypothetical protein